MAGTGHSFTAIAAPEAVLLTPGRLSGIVAVDRDAMTVTALAGTPLKVLNAGLERLGLSLHNMGDIAEQTLAGAISTGTHGTGGVTPACRPRWRGWSSSSAPARCVRRRTRTPTCSTWPGSGWGPRDPDDGDVPGRAAVPARGARAADVDEALGSFDELVAGSHHVDLYWFPHTDRMLTKRNDRLDADLSEAEPLPAGGHGWTTTSSPTRSSAPPAPPPTRSPPSFPG